MPGLASGTAQATLPWSWYSDPDVLRLEQERIFRRGWQYAGPAELVAEPGAYLTCRAGDVPIVVVRGRDDELRAFLNVCRHRGSVIVEGSGRRETLQCPYHAWTYDLDGSLRAAPRSGELGVDGICLLQLAVATWGPVIFVSPEPVAIALGGGARPAARPLRGRRDRRRRAQVPPPQRVRGRLQLEDRGRELPRVLPLPGRAPGLQRGRRRQP